MKFIKNALKQFSRNIKKYSTRNKAVFLSLSIISIFLLIIGFFLLLALSANNSLENKLNKGSYVIVTNNISSANEIKSDSLEIGSADRTIPIFINILQQQNRTLFYAYLVVLLFVLFLWVFYFQYNRIVFEKKRSEGLLLNILPYEVALELKQKGESEARQFDDVTVMLTDFVNFTATSETLSPKELVGEINICYSAFDEIITRNGLEKIKTTGDAYLAVSGLPNSDPKHGNKVVTAAIEILQFMNKRKSTLGIYPGLYDLRIGINSGSVVAGIVGVKKFSYDIWGDTVNLAARLEQNCEIGKINISENTYNLVKNEFKCNYRGKIEAKNKGSIDMYFVELP